MIRLECATRLFRGASEGTAVRAVDGVDLRVERGDFVVITGKNGSGKTTLLNLMTGLTKLTAGRVLFDGVDLARLTDRQRSVLRNEKCGFAFQFPSLIPTLTALENVMVPALVGSRMRRTGAEGRARELLDLVGLADRAGAFPHELSAGQEQRVVLARAMCNHPSVLFADEPTSHLDESSEREIMTALADLHAHRGLTMLLVTHRRDLLGHGKRAVEMAGGRLVSDTKDTTDQ